jgi:hypothetical protein
VRRGRLLYSAYRMTASSHSASRTGQHGGLRQCQAEHDHYVTPDARHPLAAADMHMMPVQFVRAKLSWVLMPVVLVDASAMAAYSPAAARYAIERWSRHRISGPLARKCQTCRRAWQGNTPPGDRLGVVARPGSAGVAAFL